MKKIVLAILAVVVVIGGFLFFRESGPVYVSALPETHVWSKGGESATVVLEEFSDFQCPACGAYFSVVKALTEEFKDTVRFSYRHFPLRSIHKNAEKGARAAEAAGEQGKFFEMHNLLFERQDSWVNDVNPSILFYGYAKELGLQAEKFKSAYKSEVIAKRVERDYQDGLAREVDSTPTFFLNGTKLNNPRSLEEFRAVVAQALSTTTNTTTPRAN